MDPRGYSITYTYDEINRPVSKNYPNATSVSYTYDKNGNRIYMTDPNFATYYTYDARNRLTSETKRIDSVNYTLTFAYDKASNLLNLTYPDGFRLNYTYDALNRISGMGSYATFTYRLDNALQSISFGNGVLTNYTYDSRDRPTRIKTTKGAETLLDLNYGYDSVENILSINSETYGYDDLDRLTSSNGPWGSIAYTYDSVGNRLTKVEGGNSTSYTYGAYNRLTQAGSTTYSYDNNGNTISKNDGQNTYSYTYDYENQMTKAVRNGQTIGEYSYDGDGVRAKKIESGQTLLYLYLGFDVVYEKTVGSDAVKHLLAGALRITKITSTSTLYYHLDHLGSTRLLTDGSGQSLFERNFKPFGPDYGGYGSETYKYTGRPQDSATGLYYLLTRYYDSETGRFTTQDPLLGIITNPHTLNKYVYVVNNPTGHADPSGHFPWAALAALATLALQFAAGFLLGFTLGYMREVSMAKITGTPFDPRKATVSGVFYGTIVGSVVVGAPIPIGVLGGFKTAALTDVLLGLTVPGANIPSQTHQLASYNPEDTNMQYWVSETTAALPSEIYRAASWNPEDVSLIQSGGSMSTGEASASGSTGYWGHGEIVLATSASGDPRVVWDPNQKGFWTRSSGQGWFFEGS